jgi:4-amino-4-deoxy-L-arabinose transferase-like glycosyltransferase
MSLSRSRAAAAVLGLAAALQRVALWLVYQPISYGDTGSYFRAGAVLRQLSLDGYDGTRVPGYPAFIALLGATPESVFLGQLVLGWLTTMLFFWWGWRLTGRVSLALASAAGYTLIPGLFLFEANLLTETLTAFLLVVCFVLLVELQVAPGTLRRMPTAAALGLASGALGLVRILFYPFALWLAPFVWDSSGPGWRRRLSATAAFLAPALTLLLGWVAWVNSTYGFLSPTTMGGYNLVQHTGVFFEYLPDEHAAIRDTYLRYRDARLAERGDQTNTIWEAIPELTEVSGLGFYDLSRELQRLSLQLIREQPDLYLRNVVEGWVDFWKAPVYWEPEMVRSQAAASLLQAWGRAGRAVSLAGNAAFLGISLWVVARFRRFAGLLRRRAWLAPWGFVWTTSILQTLADHGDNPRFLVPLQAVAILVFRRRATDE